MPLWLSIPVGRGDISEWLDGLGAYFYTWGTEVKALPRCEVLSMAAASKLGQVKRPWRTT
jgi:hypothetical protein